MQPFVKRRSMLDCVSSKYRRTKVRWPRAMPSAPIRGPLSALSGGRCSVPPREEFGPSALFTAPGGAKWSVSYSRHLNPARLVSYLIVIQCRPAPPGSHKQTRHRVGSPPISLRGGGYQPLWASRSPIEAIRKQERLAQARRVPRPPGRLGWFPRRPLALACSLRTHPRRARNARRRHGR